MSKLKTGDTIILDGVYYIVVPVKKGHCKGQGFKCANCAMVGYYSGAPFKCNLNTKDHKFNCKEEMEFGTQFRRIGKGGI